MRLAFRSLLFGLAVATSLASFAAIAAEPGLAPPPGEKCRKAEVNPVTGHVLCFDPLGAEVAPAPAAEPCKTDGQADADWTFRPNCKAQDSTPAKQPGAQG